MSAKPPTIQPSKVTSKLTELSNHFRSHRGEAVLRIRSNTFGLCLIFISTWLLPMPSLTAAFRTVTTEDLLDGSSLDLARRIFCVLEVALAAVFCYNLLEAFYAIKYPRAPLPPAATSPVKKGVVMSPSPTKRPFSIISPNTTPSKKNFSYSPMQSLSQSQSSVQLGGGSSKYPASPISTPSRVIRYTMPPTPTSSTATNVSSTSTMPPTPSPVLAYRGKHSTNGVGLPVDGLFLSQIADKEEEDNEE